MTTRNPDPLPGGGPEQSRRIHVSAELGRCLCGCGRTVAAPSSEFIQNHDIKVRGYLTGVRNGEYPGTIIPSVLIDAARSDMNGTTCGFSNREILQLSGRVLYQPLTDRLDLIIDKLDELIKETRKTNR